MLKQGEKVNNFCLNDQFGSQHCLHDYLGKKIIIYFYPKDGTPACTSQACAFRDDYQAFLDRNIVVFGISRDSVKSHLKFSTNHQIPFILLSDEGLHIADQFGVKIQKSMFGKSYFTNSRTTFIINEQGIIQRVYEKASPLENASEILRDLN